MLEVLLCGFLDRIRGDQFDLFGKLVEKLTYGWLIATLLGYPAEVFTIYISIAFTVGISPGWGGPIGDALNKRHSEADRTVFEKYEASILRKNVYVSLAARGILTGILLIPLSIYTVSLAFMVAFPLAVFIASKLPQNKWEYQEYFRGWIAGVLIYLERVFNV